MEIEKIKHRFQCYACGTIHALNNIAFDYFDFKCSLCGADINEQMRIKVIKNGKLYNPDSHCIGEY